MSDVLMREQVEWVCNGNGAPYETLQQLLLTDAALRAQLAQHTQSYKAIVEELKIEKQSLAQVTAVQQSEEAAYESTIDTLLCEKRELQQQLAEAQAEVKATHEATEIRVKYAQGLLAERDVSIGNLQDEILKLDHHILERDATIVLQQKIMDGNIHDYFEVEDILTKAGFKDYDERGDYKGLHDLLHELVARITMLEAALKSYGGHLGGCAGGRYSDGQLPCDCGWQAALKGKEGG